MSGGEYGIWCDRCGRRGAVGSTPFDARKTLATTGWTTGGAGCYRGKGFEIDTCNSCNAELAGTSDARVSGQPTERGGE